MHSVGAAAAKLSEEDVWTIPLAHKQMVSDELAAWSESDAGSTSATPVNGKRVCSLHYVHR
jgi:hypothetical protein